MKANGTGNEESELGRLRGLSARLGRDPLLVQASSGNTSMKIGALLWIKASGKWLVQAEADDFLIPVQLGRARERLNAQLPIPETETHSHELSCASIETALHAVLPQKVVVHVHSVNAIAWALRKDAPGQLSTRLREFHWRWIPYTRSGTDLARKVQKVLARAPLTDVLVLGNHGLVVCGGSCDGAEQLLAEVERCLELAPRITTRAYSPVAKESPAEAAWVVPNCATLRALAIDPISRRILSGGILYPCQAIFLSSTVGGLESSPLKQSCRFQEHRRSVRIEEDDVFCRRDMTRAEHEMLTGLANVVQRIDAAAPLRYLTFAEVMEVLNLGSENYRRAADANFSPESYMVDG